MKIEPRHIVTLNLKYGATARPLRTVAFAQLAAKALYSHTKPVIAQHVRGEVARIINVQNVPTDQIERGLAYLLELHQVVTKGEKWILSKEARDAITSELLATSTRIAGVLDRHFPGSIARDRLLPWFHDASAAVFGYYGDDWVASVCKLKQKPSYQLFSLRKCLQVANKAHGLNDYHDELARAFLAFLGSEDVADHNCLMGIGQAMFSARLVAADVGAEPTTINAFRSAVLIFDTNLLFALALDDHRLAKSVAALGKALQKIDAKPVYLLPTREEYRSALHYKRESAINVVSDFRREVLTGVSDDFISTALSRGCESKEDFERFFDSLETLPEIVCSGLPIRHVDDDLTGPAIENAQKDVGLQSQIGDFAVRLRAPWRRPKGQQSLRHDASLIHVVRTERRAGNNCWVLSLDRSLQACAVEVAGKHEMPSVVSVDSLIEILAVEGAGPDFDAGEFAPLLARMILMQCEPATNTYSLIDLEWLRRINQSARDLPPEKTIEIAKHVATERARGKKIDSTALELDVNRMLQGEFFDTETAVRESIERAKRAEETASHEQRKRERSEADFVTVRTRELQRGARDDFLRDLLWRVPVLLTVIIGVWLGADASVPNRTTAEIVQYAGSAFTLLGAGWQLIWKRFEKYRTKRAEARGAAQEELRVRDQELD